MSGTTRREAGQANGVDDGGANAAGARERRDGRGDVCAVGSEGEGHVADGRGDGEGLRDVAASVLHVRPFRAGDTDAVIALWRLAGLTRPWNDPHRDVERRLAIDDGLFLVGTLCVDAAAGTRRTEVNGDADLPIASAMGGYEGHRGWVNYLAVHPDHRGRGHARALMAALESRLLARGCAKLNLQVREDNRAALAFYERLGYAVDRSVSLGKRLIPDR